MTIPKVDLRKLHVASAGSQDFKKFRKQIIRTLDQLLMPVNLAIEDFNDANWRNRDEIEQRLMVGLLRDGVVNHGVGGELDAVVSDPSYRTLRGHLRSALPTNHRRGSLV